MYKQPGFSEELELLHSKDTDWEFLGATQLNDKIINSDGDWTPYLPEIEVQRNNFMDSFSCVSYANNNVGEMYIKKAYDIDVNWSDRFLSVISNTVPGKGNSHLNVAEAKRLNGIVEEEVYPFTQTMTQSEFFRKPLPREIIDLAITWLETWYYGYEKVKREDIPEALKLSPIQVAIDSKTNKAYNFKSYDHSIVLTKFYKNKYSAFDSYLNRFSDYESNYPFSYGMRHWYERKMEAKVIDPVTKTEHRFELVKSELDSKIYMKDSEGVLRHIETPETFTLVFGERAFREKWWSVVPFTEIDLVPKGKPIGIKNLTANDAINDLFKILLGKK